MIPPREFWRVRPLIMLSLALVIGAPPDAWAARLDDDDAETLPSDDDYALGQQAFDDEDWQAVINHLSKVVRERPWHDNAYSLLGFAHRKLGDFESSLAFYEKALTLNPHNRGALEYLGEAYLDLDRPERTEEILAKLALECERVAASFTDGDWRNECEEWAHLDAAYRAHIAGRPRPEHD